MTKAQAREDDPSRALLERPQSVLACPPLPFPLLPLPAVGPPLRDEHPGDCPADRAEQADPRPRPTVPLSGLVFTGEHPRPPGQRVSNL